MAMHSVLLQSLSLKGQNPCHAIPEHQNPRHAIPEHPAASSGAAIEAFQELHAWQELQCLCSYEHWCLACSITQGLHTFQLDIKTVLTQTSTKTHIVRHSECIHWSLLREPDTRAVGSA